MKKRVLACLLMLCLLMPVCAMALETRAVSSKPTLSFNGTTAVCECTVRGSNGDEIEVTMTLYQGSTLIAAWSDSGTRRVDMEKTKTVTKGKTYTLTVEATVNGKDIPETSVKGTC